MQQQQHAAALLDTLRASRREVGGGGVHNEDGQEGQRSSGGEEWLTILVPETGERITVTRAALFALGVAVDHSHEGVHVPGQ